MNREILKQAKIFYEVPQYFKYSNVVFEFAGCVNMSVVLRALKNKLICFHVQGCTVSNNTSTYNQDDHIRKLTKV